MRAFIPEYELKKVKDLGEALTLLQSEPDTWKPFAGGTDLMVLFEAGQLKNKKFFSIWNLRELAVVEEQDGFLILGALTTYSQVRENKLIQKEFPLLCHGAQVTGAIAIQNRGTLGGNIVNASPAADTPPALLVYGAQVELTS